MIKSSLWLLFVLFFSACSTEPLKPIEVRPPLAKIDYQKEVKPILDKRCVVCHSCYNSPCQLKLSSFEGLERGSSKAKVYLGERINAQDPSRLFIDAQSESQWREKGFNSVTQSASLEGTNNSIMLQLLDHKMKNPISEGEYFSESDNLSCAKDVDELADFLEDNPNQGMPFGFPALKEEEFITLKNWLAQGAPTSSEKELKASKTPSKAAQKGIDDFEVFLNKQDAKHIMSARYIYEHLFLAHLSFKSSPDEFFELVRSSTPSPEPIQIIPTLRPYDDPSVDKFYYRFQKIHSTIVHKTHMVYDLDAKKLQRYKELFIEPEWMQKPYVVGYKTEFNSEPFRVFEQIPAASRYAFLLDNAEYVIRTFIRGPVCKGQIALNVIRDHFWVAFMDPKYDLSLSNPEYFKEEFRNLQMPIQEGSDMKLIETFSDKYNDLSVQYFQNRRNIYDKTYPKGMSLESIWRGENNTSTPLLTVYRHFDSASVHKGVLGNLPQSAWIIDYPLFERIYYSLVAGFDVFGNVGHQVSIRRYMNHLRVEGESNFLNLLPKEDREEMFKSWYLNAEDDEVVFLSQNRAAIQYKNINSKRELLEKVVNEHILKSTNISFDSLNYTKENERTPKLPTSFKSKQDYRLGFKSLIKPGTPFIKLVNGNGSNLAYLRVKTPDAKDMVISIVVNRWHDNVSFMFNESNRLDASKDDLDFIHGFVGSYPNLFLVVESKDLPDFFDMMHNYDGSPKYIAKFLKYGIGRGDENFWEHYDWFAKRFYEENPHEAGLFDLNRYYYRVLKQ